MYTHCPFLSNCPILYWAKLAKEIADAAQGWGAFHLLDEDITALAKTRAEMKIRNVVRLRNTSR